jgi:hypothetical protein
MKFLPTPFGHLPDWRIDPRDPRPEARARALAGMEPRRRGR